MYDATDLLVWGIVLHLVGDWLLQTDWMAENKIHLQHPASWVHSGIHTALSLLVFTWPFALYIGVLHLLIDTRIPVNWWVRVVKQMQSNSTHTATVAMFLDQVLHIVVIATAALIAIQYSF
ncbi:MAG: DUF3307 domain-containing protein [Chloroflexota bacterium]